MKRIIILTLCLFILTACGGSDHKSNKSDKIQITYTVSSATEYCYNYAYVTYMESGTTHYNYKVHLPWSYSFDAQPGDYLYLYAVPDDIADNGCEYLQTMALLKNIHWNELNLIIEKDNEFLSNTTCINYDPNTHLDCESHELSSIL